MSNPEPTIKPSAGSTRFDTVKAVTDNLDAYEPLERPLIIALRDIARHPGNSPDAEQKLTKDLGRKIEAFFANFRELNVEIVGNFVAKLCSINEPGLRFIELFLRPENSNSPEGKAAADAIWLQAFKSANFPDKSATWLYDQVRPRNAIERVKGDGLESIARLISLAANCAEMPAEKRTSLAESGKAILLNEDLSKVIEVTGKFRLLEIQKAAIGALLLRSDGIVDLIAIFDRVPPEHQLLALKQANNARTNGLAEKMARIPNSAAIFAALVKSPDEKTAFLALQLALKVKISEQEFIAAATSSDHRSVLLKARNAFGKLTDEDYQKATIAFGSCILRGRAGIDRNEFAASLEILGLRQDTSQPLFLKSVKTLPAQAIGPIVQAIDNWDTRKVDLLIALAKRDRDLDQASGSVEIFNPPIVQISYQIRQLGSTGHQVISDCLASDEVDTVKVGMSLLDMWSVASCHSAIVAAAHRKELPVDIRQKLIQTPQKPTWDDFKGIILDTSDKPEIRIAALNELASERADLATHIPALRNLLKTETDRGLIDCLNRILKT